MLVPITRAKFEQVIPLIATGPQYKYYSGKFANFLQRLLISVVTASIVIFLKGVLRLNLGPIVFILGLIGGFYWLWGPIFQASMRNSKCRRYKYSGFFRGRVLDLWISEELLGKQETVNSKGDLVIIENREKRINIEVGDDSGFTAELQAPLRVAYKAISRGQIAEMLVMSNTPDLSRIEEITDIYIPSRDIWVSDYPYTQRDFFTAISRQIRNNDDQDQPRRRRRRPRDEEDWDDDY